MPARDGPQTGLLQYVLAKMVPCAAILSMFGVRANGFPYAVRHSAVIDQPERLEYLVYVSR